MNRTGITVLGLISLLNPIRERFSYTENGLKCVVLFCGTKREKLISKGVTADFLENVHASVANI